MYTEIKKFLNENDTLAKSFGIEITSISENSATAIMPYDERHKNANNVLHGAASFAIADLAFAAVVSANKIITPTLSANITYPAAGTKGPITAQAIAIASSHKIIMLEVKVYDGNDNLVAIYTAIGYRTSKTLPI